MRFKSIYLSSCVSLALAGSAYAAENVTPLSDIPRLTVSGQSSFTAWIFHNHEKRINNLNFGNGLVVPGGPGDAPTNDRTAVDIITYDKNPPLVFTTDDSRIKFSLDGPEGPWRYQAVVVFETDSNITNNIYQNYLGFQTPYGDLYVGDSFGVEDNMRFSGADAMAATGGFDGNAENVLFPTRGVNI